MLLTLGERANKWKSGSEKETTTNCCGKPLSQAKTCREQWLKDRAKSSVLMA